MPMAMRHNHFEWITEALIRERMNEYSPEGLRGVVPPFQESDPEVWESGVYLLPKPNRQERRKNAAAEKKKTKRTTTGKKQTRTKAKRKKKQRRA